MYQNVSPSYLIVYYQYNYKLNSLFLYANDILYFQTISSSEFFLIIQNDLDIIINGFLSESKYMIISLVNFHLLCPYLK